MTASSELKIRCLSQEDIPAHAALFAQVFETQPNLETTASKSWGWSDPSKFLVYGAFDETGTLVGAISYFPRVFVRGGEKLLCVEAGDVIVTQEFRGKFLFSKLIKHSFVDLSTRSISLVYGFPNRASYPGWRRARAAFPYKIKSALLPLAIGSVLARKRRLPPPVIALADQAHSLLRRLRRRRSKLVPSVSHDISPDLSALAVGVKNRFERFRPPEYFGWRYSWSGQREAFRAVLLKEAEHDIAYFILKVGADGSAEIFEYGCPDEKRLTESVRTLVYQGVLALEKSVGHKINRVIFMDATGTEPLNTVLKANGFYYRATEFQLMMYATDPKRSDLLESHEWHLTVADTDWS